jgi:ribose transport system permease protein
MNENIKKEINFKAFFKEYGIFLALIALALFFSFTTHGSFLTSGNILNVLRQISMMGIAAVGMSFVLLLGGIDLSLGSIVTLVNIVASWLMVLAGIPAMVAIAVSILMSVTIGFINGWIVANIKMPPLIVTLASMTILEGLAFIICKGSTIFPGTDTAVKKISEFPVWFRTIGQGYLGQIPIPVIIMIIILLIGMFILNMTYFGRYFYAVGGNEEASQLSGINVKHVKYMAYALSGFFAGIAGIIMLSRNNTGHPTSGKGFEMDVLTACVLGGVSINGGSGKISNVIAGMCILGVLNNGMVLVGLSQYHQMIVKGAVLMLAVGFDCYQKAKKQKNA